MSGASISMLFTPRTRSALFTPIMPRTETVSPVGPQRHAQRIGVRGAARAAHFDHFDPARLREISRVDQVDLLGQDLAEDAFQHGVFHQVRVQVRQAAVVADGDFRDRLVRELRDERAQLFAELEVRLELLVLLGRNGGHVDRVLHRSADQIIAQLFGDARAHDVLRFFGRARDVRRGNHIGMLDQARIGGRLGFKYVEPGAGHVSAFERREQRRFVHQFAARAIHDANAFLRQREDSSH